jgi:hypothetical protein
MINRGIAVQQRREVSVGIYTMSVVTVLRYMRAGNACAVGLSTHRTLIALRRKVACWRRLGVSLRLA